MVGQPSSVTSGRAHSPLFSAPLDKSASFLLFIYSWRQLVCLFAALRDGDTRSVRVQSMKFIFSKSFIIGLILDPSKQDKTHYGKQKRSGLALT